MAKIVSMDLRLRLVGAVQGGSSRRAAAARFGVSPSCAVKLLGRVAATGSAVPGQRGRRPGAGKLAGVRTELIGWVEATPDVTMPELAERLERTHGITATPSALSRLLCKAGWTYKKSADRTGDRAGRCRQAAPALAALDPALAVPPLAAGGVH